MIDDEDVDLMIHALTKFIDPVTGADTISLKGPGRPKSQTKDADDASLVHEIDWRIAEAEERGSKRPREDIFEEFSRERKISVDALNKMYRIATKKNANIDEALAVRLRAVGDHLHDWIERIAWYENCPPGMIRRSYERGMRILRSKENEGGARINSNSCLATNTAK